MIFIYTLDAESFVHLLDEHNNFKKMATFRALDRRAYFLSILELVRGHIEYQLKLTKNTSYKNDD